MGESEGPRTIGGGWHLIHFLLSCGTGGAWVLVWLIHAYWKRRVGPSAAEDAPRPANSSRPLKILAGCFAAVFALMLSAGFIEARREAEAERAYVATLSPDERAAYEDAKVRERVAREAQRAQERAEAAEAKAAREAAEAEKEAKQEARSNRELQAISDCHGRVKQAAKFSTEVDFPWGYDYSDNDARVVMSGRVKLMNGLGLQIPHIYKCVYSISGTKIDKVVSFDLWQG